MKKRFIDEMKKTLLEERGRLLLALNRNSENIENGIEAAVPKDFADIASYATDQDMLDALSAKDIKKLQAIDSALIRIEDNKYGKCIRCSKEISEDRLRALPYAVKCIDCQSCDERK